MTPDVAPPPPDMIPLREVKRRYTLRVLERCGGDKRAAARVLGISLRTLYSDLTRWGMHVPMRLRSPANGDEA